MFYKTVNWLPSLTKLQLSWICTTKYRHGNCLSNKVDETKGTAMSGLGWLSLTVLHGVVSRFLTWLFHGLLLKPSVNCTTHWYCWTLYITWHFTWLSLSLSLSQLPTSPCTTPPHYQPANLALSPVIHILPPSSPPSILPQESTWCLNSGYT